MTRWFLPALLGLLFLCTVAACAEEGQAEVAPSPEAQIEVVFVLDTTGSMSGLIQGAKDKIWSIAKMLMTGSPTPSIKMGLIAYRDRGDAYVTQQVSLSDDLDAVYKELTAFKADGGGDGLESVNQALNEAVTQMQWSTGSGVYHVIFLVGDFGPHMDYPDDVKYSDSCDAAAKAGILINTVQCGTVVETTDAWKRIAALGNGTFLQIQQSGGTVTIATPYDKELATLAVKLDNTRVVYGTADEQRAGGAMFARACMNTSMMESTVAADRAQVTAGPCGPTGPSGAVKFFENSGTKDLVNDIVNGKAQLAKVDVKLLPEEMRKMTPAQREGHINKLKKERADLQKRINDLSTQRDTYQTKALAKLGNATQPSFDGAVLSCIRSQAVRNGIAYPSAPLDGKLPAAYRTWSRFVSLID